MRRLAWKKWLLPSLAIATLIACDSDDDETGIFRVLRGNATDAAMPPDAAPRGGQEAGKAAPDDPDDPSSVDASMDSGRNVGVDASMDSGRNVGKDPDDAPTTGDARVSPQSTDGDTRELDSGPNEPEGGTDFDKLCWEICEVDEDCTQSGMREEFVCEEGQCVPGCIDDDHCSDLDFATAAPCSAQADCDDGASGESVCVILPTSDSRCATAAAGPEGAPECPVGTKPVTRMLADSSGIAHICVTPRQCMPDGACHTPCTENPNNRCGRRLPSHCEPASGQCSCLVDADCARVPNAPSCDTDTGQCRCTDDDHCDEGEICHEGRCRLTCNVPLNCLAKKFDGTEHVCE